MRTPGGPGRYDLRDSRAKERADGENDQTPGDPRAPGNVRNAFEHTEVTGVVDIVRTNRFLRRFKVYTCYDYRGLPL